MKKKEKEKKGKHLCFRKTRDKAKYLRLQRHNILSRQASTRFFQLLCLYTFTELPTCLERSASLLWDGRRGVSMSCSIALPDI